MEPSGRSCTVEQYGFHLTHTVDEAWKRCEYIDTEKKIVVLPMWYHRLDAMEHNIVTEGQKALGWNDFERRKIMQWYYHHKEAVA